MGVHFYDSSTYSTEQQKKRLQTAILLSRHSIPTIVWAEDALAFAHTVPTCLFALQLLVEDHLVEEAGRIIQNNSPYCSNPEPLPASLELYIADREKPSCFPRSSRLTLARPSAGEMSGEHTPQDIVIHPASFFQFAIGHRSHSLPLDGIPDDVRFPTRTAFFDSLIATMLDPPLGYFHRTLFNTMLNFASYLVLYTLREEPRLVEGKLNSECRAVVDSLKEENRHWLEGFLNPDVRMAPWDSIHKRRELLTMLGRTSELRPFPSRKRAAFLPDAQRIPKSGSAISQKFDDIRRYSTSAAAHHRPMVPGRIQTALRLLRR